ncbi:hypothetical protein [Streptomyces sp. NPDC047928]|uniref:hypothetical protein n=1 Tax=unclassified Streptomyces TaxID=2593676 RepID=UPI003711E86E
MNGGSHYHLDVSGHSITVNLAPGRHGAVELLVDGKVIGYLAERRGGTATVAGELADEPVRPFVVRLRGPRLGVGRPRVTLDLDGGERPMPRRRTPRATGYCPP